VSDPRETFGSILRDELNLCDATYMTREIPYIQATWDGTWELSHEWMWGYIDIFLTPEEVHSLRRQAKAMRDFWRDLAKLSDKPSLLEPKIIDELERRMVTAARPSGYRVAAHATNVSAQRAASVVRRLLTEESWRKRS
jgi:hypothetical protein